MSDFSVVTFDPEFLPAFAELNRQWIETYFSLEPMDLAQLEDPYESVLRPGGEIFFLLESGAPVGTVAMIPHGPGCYELAKMAVSPAFRAKGYGSVLIEAAVGWARQKGAEKIILLSNTVLKPAISLYEKHGFQTVRLGDHPDYKRCNIEMELRLRA
jgi:GNAT superfamily N-acetyltransferase